MSDSTGSALPHLAALLQSSFARHRGRIALKFLGHAIRYEQLDEETLHLAAYLQSLKLRHGDRVAVMMPNLPQYALAAMAILRAGFVLVNTNPYLRAQELQYQLKDSGAKVIWVWDHALSTLAPILPQTQIHTVIVTRMGDAMGPLRGWWVNQKSAAPLSMMPAVLIQNQNLETVGISSWAHVTRLGKQSAFTPPPLSPDSIALLQYTGGTTGLSKGAILLHRHLVANLRQCQQGYGPAFAQVPTGEQIHWVCALPLFHIFGFSTNLLLALHMGATLMVLPHLRDISDVIKTLRTQRFHALPAVSTWLHGLMQHPDFDQVDWQHLRLTLVGGMATPTEVAQAWQERTQCPICEGYGLTESAPAVTCNPTDHPKFNGTIGRPLPDTRIKLLNDLGEEVPEGQAGEMAISGPQVMAGYWQRPDETDKIMTEDGFMRTGDMAVLTPEGNYRLIDRKKDMVIVSGFKVYPSEVEAVVMRCPGVLECTAIGMRRDGIFGEALKLLVVPSTPDLTEEGVRTYCRQMLSGYKQPFLIELRTSLPKNEIGKVLRRELRGY